MEALRTANGSFTPALLLATGLLAASVALVAQMRDVAPGSASPAPALAGAGVSSPAEPTQPSSDL